MKLVDIINLNETLKTIIDNKDYDVDVVTKFNFLGIMKKIEPYIQNFETVKRTLFEKYGEKNNKEQIFINQNSDNYNDFKVEFEKLLNGSIDDLEIKIKKDDVFNKGIPSDYLVALYEFIV